MFAEHDQIAVLFLLVLNDALGGVPPSTTQGSSRKAAMRRLIGCRISGRERFLA